MDISQAKRVVVKIGTSTLTYKSGKMNLERISKITQVLSGLKNSGKEIVLVSSGAIAVGTGRLNLSERPRDIRERQAMAAVGQCNLMAIYDRCFSEYSQVVAQILLTRDVFNDNLSRNNARGTFNQLLSIGVIPIVNENDAISTDELEFTDQDGISFGDNDCLSAYVAILTGADALIMLTDTKGFYDSDPRVNKDAKLIERVDVIDDALFSLAGEGGSSRGTGGMRSKLTAARLATESGICTSIIPGDNPAILYDLLNGNPAGTMFAAQI